MKNIKPNRKLKKEEKAILTITEVVSLNKLVEKTKRVKKVKSPSLENEITQDFIKRKDDKSSKILMFDVKTGELVVQKENTDTSNCTVVDTIYKDGFFSKN